MNNTQDLRIKKDILPLFDYTINSFSKKIVLNILEEPLISRDKILERQNILKGFIENNNILKDYNYPFSYFFEVYDFLTNSIIEDLSKSKVKYRFFTSKYEKNDYRSKFIQMLLLFNKLHSFYFSKLEMKVFPEAYKKRILKLHAFFSSFNLTHYEKLIKNDKLKDSHIVNLSSKISIKQSKDEISSFWDDFFMFEAYHSLALGMVANNFKFPEFTENNLILDNFFHPKLNRPVINSLETSGNVILLTGPNMSGKSTLLKAVGLCIHLGHVGLGIPASNAKIPFFSSISVCINHRDDIINGYSHFMTEVVNLRKVVEEVMKGKRHFAVFDELFSGTNAEDAIEICTTTIKGLSKFKNSIFFISTHLQQLKKVKTIDKIQCYYIDCKLIENNPTFTYKLKKGWSELKVGRILFEKEGLNKMLN